jgi:hypothetical protein
MIAHLTFILKHVVIVGKSSYRLGIFSNVLPLSLFNMFFAIKGRGFWYLICSYSPSGLPSLEDFSFVRTWVLPSCPPPSLGFWVFFLYDWQVLRFPLIVLWILTIFTYHISLMDSPLIKLFLNYQNYLLHEIPKLQILVMGNKSKSCSPSNKT